MEETYKPRILVVEDEPEMVSLLRQALEESNYEVTVALNGKEALKHTRDIDLAIVDVMMPIMSGFDLVAELRQSGWLKPVIFLTAKDGLNDLLKGYEIGGDDYLIKPFRLAELLARIHALLKRTRSSSEVLTFDDVKMDVTARKVWRGGNQLYLSNTEFAVLRHLLLRAGQIVTKELLLREIWDADTLRDANIVEVYINYLRHKLEASGKSRVIFTIKNKGYILRSNVAKS